MSGDFWRRLRLPWAGRRDLREEVDDELEFHLDMRARELVDAGADPSEARARAAREFGDVRRTRERYVRRRARDQRYNRVRMGWDELRQDLRFATRALRHRLGFTATAVLVLALGIGAPTTVFTLVDALFFERPAHVAEPHRLVRLFRSWARGQGGGTLGNPDYLHYRDNATTLSGLAAYGGTSTVAYRMESGDPDQLLLRHVSADYFEVLGVRPHVGRTFRPDENEAPDAHPVAVLSHAFWTRATGSDPNAIGRTIALNGIPFTVVGVAPEDFRGISPAEAAPDVWVPIAMYGALRRAEDMAWWERHPNFRSNWLDVVGRVADGVTLEAAQANLEALGEALTYEGKDPAEGVMVTRQFLYRPSVEASMTSLSRMLLAVVAIVLLIAAANVAVLLLSRASTRGREIGIRAAIGASKGRIARQLLTESLLLGLLGGALGLGLAFALSGLAARLLPLPLDAPFTPSGWVLAAAAGLSILTSLSVGLAPALQAGRIDVGASVQLAASAPSSSRLRATLVVSQVALSLVLVAGAFLFASSFRAADTEELGFEREAILIVGTNLRSLGYSVEEGATFVRDALERLATVPGVRAVTTSRMVPFAGDWSTEIDALPGSTPNTPDDKITVGLNAIAPDYFDVTGIEIVRGRPLGWQDGGEATPAIVINEALAALLWPGEDPIGRLLPAGGSDHLVVGLARDATYYELGEQPRTQAYLSQLQRYQPDINFFLRTDVEPSRLASTVQNELRAIDATLAFAPVTTMDSVVEEEVARYEISAILVGLFGAIALLLAATGLYGVVSHLVGQRTREIGVRMALGADRGRVTRQVLSSGLRLAAWGVGLGLLGATGLRGYTEGLLFGVESADPVPALLASLVLLGATAVASLAPARRAARVDPVDAMRSD